MTAPRTWIMLVTAGSLTVAFVVSAVWWTRSSGTSSFEPTVQVLGLLGGITGIVAERWAAGRERRAEALQAIGEELRDNGRILASPPFAVDTTQPARRQVYPRLSLSAVNAALSSAVLSPRRDETLVGMLHDWRNEAEIFNHQLSLAEILAFTNGSDEVLRDLHQGLHSADGPLERMQEHLTALLATSPLAAAGLKRRDVAEAGGPRQARVRRSTP
ncbi:hypothetical protein NLX85_06205 [Micromonospora sp. A3M-1-15]|uniref:hypothetical protein n=1 Tax=Micromonospora sp. A3M-1-15 TaxID=2962035 RepID=UPI0020B6B665|nr:hypothetical protein [Micromonospora sp. A3M-1-15]MCP3782956.1 hypothetical protein [Micromonospora sp. A3M-1-15]